MILIYINDINKKQLAFYEKHNMTIPVMNDKYTIREIIIVNGSYTLLLNEIKNKPIDVPEIGTI